VRRALAACLLLGCTSPPFEFAELPAPPIAFAYQTVEQTERILDAAAAERKQSDTRRARDLPVDSGEHEFLVEIEGLQKLAGVRTDRDLLMDQQGRVALYVAPEQQLELPDALVYARALDWSPDHERLMLNMNPRGAFQLFEWVRATGEVRQLTSGPESRIDGCYGPGGAIAWVQFMSVKERSRTQLWVQFPRQAARALTEGPADLQPVWAPDGSRIVYARMVAGGELELRWVDPASGEGGFLGRGRSPDFTPDGRFIVYSARTARGWQLRRMHADGSGKRSLGGSGYQENSPAVSPDGRWVVYAAQAREESPISRLFVRSLDGGADRQLEISGSGLLPVW
jgi:Tol biopolymer transport system component